MYNINKKNMARPRLPDWIRVKAYAGEGRSKVQGVISDLGLHTVCESARCPNLGECWHKQTATFMILGDICTRDCKFCAVNHGEPNTPDLQEPAKIAEAVNRMGLRYVVITSVTRDDLEDGGSEHFAEVIKVIREVNGDDVKIEVLTPDFNGDILPLKKVLNASPSVFNHNIETVKRLSSVIRTTATYEKSLNFLKDAVQVSDGRIPIKSGLMVGLGEGDQEVETAIMDLRDAGISMLTIGQYLPPSSNHWPLDRYVHPDTFEKWRLFALDVGFTNVASAPLVRSSYQAEAFMGMKSNR